MIVGLGNPGAAYDGTPHNIGFEVAERLRARWELGKPKSKYRGLISDGRTGVGGPRVAILTAADLHERGRQVGRPGARRAACRARPHHRVHDEIDLPFGEIRTRLGGGLAGHNGLKSIKAALGTADFQRVRVGVGPPADDRSGAASRPTCSANSGSRRTEVQALIDSAADAVERAA